MRDINHVVSSVNVNYFALTTMHVINVNQVDKPREMLTGVCLMACGACVGAVLPDIDHQYSNIHFFTRPISKVFKMHRGVTHSIIGGVAMTGLMYVLNLLFPALSIAFLSASLAYILHLVEDDFSSAGVLWKWPFESYTQGTRPGSYYKKRAYSNLRYKSSGLFEQVFGLINFVILLTWIFGLLGSIA